MVYVCARALVSGFSSLTVDLHSITNTTVLTLMPPPPPVPPSRPLSLLLLLLLPLLLLVPNLLLLPRQRRVLVAVCILRLEAMMAQLLACALAALDGTMDRS